METFLEKHEDIFELVLEEKVELTPDTSRFRFKLPNNNDVLGLPVGKHLSLISENEDGQITIVPLLDNLELTNPQLIGK